MNTYFSKILSIIFISVLISLTHNHFNPNGLKLIRDARILNWETDSLASFRKTDSLIADTILVNKKESTDSVIADKKRDTVETFTKPKAIKIDFAYKLYRQGIKFIDARPIEEFTDGHIKGAVNIPFYGSENYGSVLRKISKDEIVVTYCSGEDCDLSILLADELFEKGYKKVYVFFGGWNDWLVKRYPTNKL